MLKVVPLGVRGDLGVAPKQSHITLKRTRITLFSQFGMEKYHGRHDFTEDFFRRMLNFALLVLRMSSTFVSNSVSTFQHRRIDPVGQ